MGRVTFLKNMPKTLVYYKQLLDEEVNTVVTYLYKMPDARVCLYALSPDDDSLPHFFPCIFPYTTEARDVEV